MQTTAQSLSSTAPSSPSAIPLQEPDLHDHFDEFQEVALKAMACLEKEKQEIETKNRRIIDLHSRTAEKQTKVTKIRLDREKEEEVKNHYSAVLTREKLRCASLEIKKKEVETILLKHQEETHKNNEEANKNFDVKLLVSMRQAAEKFLASTDATGGSQ